MAEWNRSRWFPHTFPRQQISLAFCCPHSCSVMSPVWYLWVAFRWVFCVFQLSVSCPTPQWLRWAKNTLLAICPIWPYKRWRQTGWCWRGLHNWFHLPMFSDRRSSTNLNWHLYFLYDNVKFYYCVFETHLYFCAERAPVTLCHE